MSSVSRNPDRSTWGRRCEQGCATWPDKVEFERCLHCGRPTSRHSGLSPMAMKEAKSLLVRAKFNAFYAKRCERLRIPVAGDLPEWYDEQLDPIPEHLLTPTRRTG